ncbi:hypothetical protein XELAEV_18044566mg [Xenopus laevis]|uniref:Uncharacterized protein n=1 Tax=Xenopus laevis TaxID=8355 RepID=A0A974H3D4_XENLA|nr:hypothetical protein XELAEV_18044566mg [Xenopus laevis]
MSDNGRTRAQDVYAERMTYLRDTDSLVYCKGACYNYKITGLYKPIIQPKGSLSGRGNRQLANHNQCTTSGSIMKCSPPDKIDRDLSPSALWHFHQALSQCGICWQLDQCVLCLIPDNTEPDHSIKATLYSQL